MPLNSELNNTARGLNTNLFIYSPYVLSVKYFNDNSNSSTNVLEQYEICREIRGRRQVRTLGLTFRYCIISFHYYLH